MPPPYTGDQKFAAVYPSSTGEIAAPANYTWYPATSAVQAPGSPDLGIGLWCDTWLGGIVLTETVEILDWYVLNLRDSHRAAVVVNGDTSVLDSMTGVTTPIVPLTGVYPAGTTFTLWGNKLDQLDAMTSPVMVLSIRGAVVPRPDAELDAFMDLGVPVPGDGTMRHVAVNAEGTRAFLAVGSWLDRMDFDPDSHTYLGRDGIWAYFPEGQPGAPVLDGVNSTLAVEGTSLFFARSPELNNAERVFFTSGLLDAHGSPAYTPWSALGGGTFPDPQPIYSTTYINENHYGQGNRWMCRAPWDGKVYYAIPASSWNYPDGTSGVAEAGIWRLDASTESSPTRVVDWTHLVQAPTDTDDLEVLAATDPAVVATSDPIATIDGDVAFLTVEGRWPPHWAPPGTPAVRRRYINFLHPDGSITKHEWRPVYPNNAALRPALLPSRRGGVWVQDNLLSQPGDNPVDRYTPADGLVESERTQWLFMGESYPRAAASDDLGLVVAYATLDGWGFGLTSYRAVYWPGAALPEVDTGVYLGSLVVTG